MRGLALVVVTLLGLPCICRTDDDEDDTGRKQVERPHQCIGSRDKCLNPDAAGMDMEDIAGAVIETQQPEHVVVDTQLYDILGVLPNATASQIRKAFRQQSLKLHPDKNKDDPNAEETYRTILEAYEILSNPERRKLYDAQGLNAERVAEWLNILRKEGPAMALAALHRAWKHLVYARHRPYCLMQPIYGMEQQEQCGGLNVTEDPDFAEKHYGQQVTNLSAATWARWECEDKVLTERFEEVMQGMELKGVDKSDGHRLSHWGIKDALRDAMFNLTGLPKDRWTTATTPSVSYGLHLAGLGAANCAAALPVTFLEVGSGMGLSLAMFLLTVDNAGSKAGVGKIVSVDDYKGYSDEEREDCLELHRRLLVASKNEVLEPEERVLEGCGKAWRTAARLLYANMKMPVEMVSAPSLDSLGWKQLQERRWLRSFSAVTIRLGGNRTFENVLSDIMLATELLRHQGILILEDWFDPVFDTNVPGLYSMGGAPVTLGGCLDNTFVPWFVSWKLKYYIFQRKPEAELEGNPFLDGAPGEAADGGEAS